MTHSHVWYPKKDGASKDAGLADELAGLGLVIKEQVARMRENQYNGHPWSSQQSAQLYGLDKWGKEIAHVSDEGHMMMSPKGPSGASIDLYELAGGLKNKGLNLPLVVRFPAVLQKRVNDLCRAFEAAREETGYLSAYTAIYPIKVNQNEEVVRQIASTPGVKIGLEAGSKAELMAVLGSAPKGATIVCNGYKDRSYIHLALMGQQMGHKVYIVMEKESEWPLIQSESSAMGVVPCVGLRVRLTSALSGKWADSGGEHSKFGLTAAQLINVSAKIKAAGLSTCVKLLHVHMGSQISSIEEFQRGFKEAVSYFAQVSRLGFKFEVMDIGGGLGVDYDGQGEGEGSVNYRIKDYAMVVLKSLQDICKKEMLPVPQVFSESGRALTAHHAVLLMQVSDVEKPLFESSAASGAHYASGFSKKEKTLRELLERSTHVVRYQDAAPIWEEVCECMKNVASAVVSEDLNLSDVGTLEMVQHGVAKVLLSKVGALAVQEKDVVAVEALVSQLNYHLAQSYIMNFSLFQSMPDAWAIDQILPIMPIHRLHTKPTVQAVLHDLTCDSDGRVQRYVTSAGAASCLPVHEWNAQDPYIFAVFMIGAYQEVMGNKHNLFASVPSVNVFVHDSGEVVIKDPQNAINVGTMCESVGYNADLLAERVRMKLEDAGVVGFKADTLLADFQAALNGSTYLGD